MVRVRIGGKGKCCWALRRMMPGLAGSSLSAKASLLAASAKKIRSTNKAASNGFGLDERRGSRLAALSSKSYRPNCRAA